MSRDGRRRRALTAAALALPLIAAGLAPTTTAQANDRRPVAGTKPTWARASADRGKTSDEQRLDARIWLGGKDPKGLDAYAQAVSTPGSPQYRKFLSPADWGARFGPSAEQVSAVKSWLTSSHLRVDAVNSHYIQVTGQVAQAKKAFGTDFRDYAAQGAVVRA